MLAGSAGNPVADSTNTSDAKIRRAYLWPGGAARNLCWNARDRGQRHLGDGIVRAGFDLSAWVSPAATGMAMDCSCGRIRSIGTACRLHALRPETIPR